MRAALFLAMMSSAWTPLDLGARLKAWWAAPGAGNITLNGSGIASWTDEVGGYVLAQGTAANQPTYSAAGYSGGRSCAVFDGANDSLVRDGVPAAMPTGADPSEIWADARMDSTSGDSSDDVLFDYGATPAGTPHRRTLARIAGNVAAVGYDGATITGPASAAGERVWRGVFDAASARLDMDGASGATTTGLTPTTGTSTVRMGAATFGGGPWRGAVRQVLITDPLSDEEAALLLAYLNGGL